MKNTENNTRNTNNPANPAQKNPNFFSCYKCFVSGKIRLIRIIITALSFILVFACLIQPQDFFDVALGVLLMFFYSIGTDTLTDYFCFKDIVANKCSGADFLRSSNLSETVLKKVLITDTAIHWIKGILLSTIVLLFTCYVSKPAFDVSTLAILLLFISFPGAYIVVVMTTLLFSRRFAHTLSIQFTVSFIFTVFLSLALTIPLFIMFANNMIYPTLALTVFYILLAVVVTILNYRVCINSYRSGFIDF